MFKLFRYLKSVWVEVVITIVFLMLQVWLQLQLPNTMADVSKYINIMTINPSTSEAYKEALKDIWIMGGKMLAYALGVTVTAIIVGYTSSRISTIFGQKLRNDIFRKVTSFSINDYDKFGTSSLITRTTNDVQQIQMVIFMGLRIIVSAPLTVILAIIYASQLDMSLMIVLLVSVPIVLIVTTIIGVLVMPLMKKMQTKVDRVTLVLRENLTGVRVIRAFNRENDESQKFDVANKDLTNVTVKTNRIFSIMTPSISIVMNLTFLAIFMIGFYNFNGQSVNVLSTKVSAIMSIAQYSLQIMSSLLMVVMIFVFITRAQVSAARINAVLETSGENIDSNESSISLNNNSKCELEFNDVIFSYPDASLPTLEHVSFKASAGETIAFIGSTGSGKSTLINLIPRLYDVSSGSITLNGVNVNDIELNQLRKKIGFVPQKSLLFTGTIKENLLYGNPNASDEDIENAIKVAQAKKFINEKEKGLNESVSQGGTNFSGGQKQRLAIARALVRKADVYIFDDSFSALDFKTDVKVRSALKKYTKDSLVIIVGQRVSSIMNADKIIVLDEGKVVGQGTHSELLNSCQVYQEIVKSQLDPDEVKNTISLSNKIDNEEERGE